MTRNHSLPLLAVLALVACGKKSDDDNTGPGTDVTTGTGTGTTGDSGTIDVPTQPETDLELTGKAGSVMVLRSQPNGFMGEDGRVVALFVDRLEGYLNPAQCLLHGGPCLKTTIPDGSEVGAVPTDTTFLDGVDWYDVGNVVIDDTPLFNYEGYGFPLPTYLGGAPQNFEGEGNIELDGDYTSYVGLNDFPYVMPVVVTSPEPGDTSVVGPGETVEITWEEDPSGEVLVAYGETVLNPVGTTATIHVDDLGLEGPLDVGFVSVSRMNFSEVDAAGNTITVQTIAEQLLVLEYEDPNGWAELARGQVGNRCEEARVLPVLPPGKYLGDTRQYDDTIDLPLYNDATGRPTPGPDGVVPIELDDGEELTVVYRQLLEDAAAYLLAEDCDPYEVEVGADSTSFGEPETFTYTARSDEKVYLVLDSANFDGGRFSLEITVSGTGTGTGTGTGGTGTGTGGTGTGTGTGGTGSGTGTGTGGGTGTGTGGGTGTGTGTGTGGTGTGTGGTGTGTGGTGTGTGGTGTGAPTP